jgi:hypothetical protein
LAGWFFGFMYEDAYDESFDFDEDDEDSNVATNAWNPLNVAIFASYALTTAATKLPILLIPTIGQDFLTEENDNSAFSSRAASSAVLGIACGKFLNGQVGDFLGARSTSQSCPVSKCNFCYYGLFLCGILSKYTVALYHCGSWYSLQPTKSHRTVREWYISGQYRISMWCTHRDSCFFDVAPAVRLASDLSFWCLDSCHWIFDHVFVRVGLTK